MFNCTVITQLELGSCKLCQKSFCTKSSEEVRLFRSRKDHYGSSTSIGRTTLINVSPSRMFWQLPVPVPSILCWADGYLPSLRASPPFGFYLVILLINTAYEGTNN